MCPGVLPVAGAAGAEGGRRCGWDGQDQENLNTYSVADDTAHGMILSQQCAEKQNYNVEARQRLYTTS